MADQILIDILGYGHVLSAMGWLGAGILTTFVLGPSVRKLSPGAGLEFNAKVLPRILVFVQGSIGSTFLFGLLLLYVTADGDFGWLTSSPQGREISAGIILALLTAAVVWTVTVPSFRKVIKIANEAIKVGQAPSPDIMKYGKRARMGSLIGVVLLLLVLAMMVASGFS